MIFIVARNHFQAQQAAEANGLENLSTDRIQWRYLFAGYRLRGYAKPQVWLCPGWELGKTTEELRCFHEHFTSCKARIIELTNALELPHADA